MEIGEVFYPENRMNWRRWLESNHQTAKEIWMRTPHLKSGLPRLGYDDAVEEALCWGWIDGQSFPLKYQKLRIGFVMECRKSNLAMSDKRLAYLIKMTAAGKQFGTMVN